MDNEKDYCLKIKGKCEKKSRKLKIKDLFEKPNKKTLKCPKGFKICKCNPKKLKCKKI